MSEFCKTTEWFVGSNLVLLKKSEIVHYGEICGIRIFSSSKVSKNEVLFVDVNSEKILGKLMIGGKEDARRDEEDG